MSDAGGWHPISGGPETGADGAARSAASAPGRDAASSSWGPTPPSGWGAPPTTASGWGAASQVRDVKPGVIPLRPLAVGEVLDGAFATMRRAPAATLGLAAAVAAVLSLLTVVVPSAFGAVVSPFSLGDAGQGSAAADAGLEIYSALASLLGYAAQTLFGAFLTGMVIVVLGQTVLGRDVDIAAVWARVRPRLWALVGCSLLASIGPVAVIIASAAVAVLLAAAVGPATLLLGVPLIVAGLGLAGWLYISWTMATPALVLESLGPVRALRRSRQLVRGAWWRQLGIVLLSVIIAGVLNSVLLVPSLVLIYLVGGGDFFHGDPSALAVVVYAIGVAAASAVTLPFTAAVRGLLYIDRRMRVEALDVALVEAASSASAS